MESGLLLHDLSGRKWSLVAVVAVTVACVDAIWVHTNLHPPDQFLPKLLTVLASDIALSVCVSLIAIGGSALWCRLIRSREPDKRGGALAILVGGAVLLALSAINGLRGGAGNRIVILQCAFAILMVMLFVARVASNGKARYLQAPRGRGFDVSAIASVCIFVLALYFKSLPSGPALSPMWVAQRVALGFAVLTVVWSCYAGISLALFQRSARGSMWPAVALLVLGSADRWAPSPNDRPEGRAHLSSLRPRNRKRTPVRRTCFSCASTRFAQTIWAVMGTGGRRPHLMLSQPIAWCSATRSRNRRGHCPLSDRF